MADGREIFLTDSDKCYEVMAIRDASLYYDTKQVGSERAGKCTYASDPEIGN